MSKRTRRTALSVVAGVVAAALVTVAAVQLNTQPAGAADCKTFWVAPNGDDAAKGTENNPWKTVTRARDEIRNKHLNDHQNCDITVNLKAGEYPVSVPSPSSRRPPSTTSGRSSAGAVSTKAPRCVTTTP